MKKVKYKGDHPTILITLDKDVEPDDVIEVEDDFFNALFEEVVEVVEEKKKSDKEVVK